MKTFDNAGNIAPNHVSIWYIQFAYNVTLYLTVLCRAAPALNQNLRSRAGSASTPIFRLRAALRVHIWHSSYIWCWKRAPLSVNMGPPSKMGTGLPMVRTSRIFWTSVPSCLSLINSVFITSHTTCMSGVLHVLRGLYQWITIQRRDIVASDKICPAHATTSTHAHWQPSTRDFVLEYVVFMCLPFWTDKVCLLFIV